MTAGKITLGRVIVLCFALGVASSCAQPADPNSTPVEEGARQSGAPSDECSPPQDLESVTIGVVEALSGGASSYGQGTLRGAQLAVDKVNEEGGIEGLGGATLELATYDIQSDASLAPAQTQRAISDGSIAIIGAAVSDAVIAGTNISERAGVPWLNTGALANDITARGYETVFAIQPTANQVAQATTKLFTDYRESLGGLETVAIAHIELAYGQELFDDFTAGAAAAGLEIVDEVAFAPGTTEFDSIATRFASVDPDIIYHIGFPPDSLAFGQALENASVDSSVVFFGGLPPGVAIAQAPDISDSWSMRLDLRESYEVPSDYFTYFFTAYEEQNGVAPENTSEHGFTAVMAIRDGLNASCSEDPSELAHAISQLELTLDEGNIFPGDPITFDENGIIENPFIGMVQIQDGEIVTVWPDEVATLEAIKYE